MGARSHAANLVAKLSKQQMEYNQEVTSTKNHK